MWRALFIGWLALALAEEAKEDTATLSKRQTARGSTVVYGSGPTQYTLQSPERVNAAHSQAQAQVPADYQQQSELYVISPNRKAVASALTYSNESPRRPQYIQLATLQQQLSQQSPGRIQHVPSQHQPQPQPQPHPHPQVAYESLIGQTEAGHGFYRPAIRYHQPPPQQQQQQHQHQQIQAQPEARVQPDHQAVQYAASAIVDSQSGSFERELAQLVAANRAQEQKYSAVQQIPVKKQPAPQQYLKEITRPASRPLPITRVANSGSPPVQYQQIQVPQNAVPALYQLIYQADQLQQLPQVPAQPQYKPASHEPAQYARPQLQQYIHAQPQTQPQPVQSHLQAVRLRPEEDGSQLLRAHPGLPAAAPAHQRAPNNEASRSTIYVSQSTPLKKPAYTALAALAAAEREEEDVAKHAPQPQQAVRVQHQRNRPLTQEEFQQLLQSGAYTATFVPSDNPNSPHQEYLLHPVAAQSQRPAYTNDKQESQTVTYLLPQSQHQRQAKKRPIYNIQQA